MNVAENIDNMQFYSEGGLELLSRFNEKPRLINLDKVLFSSDISNESIIEIIGASSTGKTLLLCQLLVKYILPAQYKGIKINGYNVCAVLIDTLGHIQISKIVELINSMIHNIYQDIGVQPSIETIDAIVNTSLENLSVINCCNNDQFQLTLHTLEDKLFSNKRIALLAIDNLLAYYWQNRKEKGILSIDNYVKSFIQFIQTCIFRFKIMILYTRWDKSMFENKLYIKNTNVLEKINVNYRLHLCNSNITREFICYVESLDDIREICYTICDSGINWIL